MAPTRWDPYKDILFLQERMSRMFDEALTRHRQGPGLTGCGYFPPVDIFETDRSIVLRAELPGLDLDDLTIDVDGNIVTIRGERRLKKNLCEENYHRMERFYGTFERVFCLPDLLDRTTLRAHLCDGVLNITVSKARGPQTRSVKIRVE